jgi:hypothetical protein
MEGTVVANILNMLPSSLGVGLGVTFHHNKNSFLRNVTQDLGLGLILWNDVNKCIICVFKRLCNLYR